MPQIPSIRSKSGQRAVVDLVFELHPDFVGQREGEADTAALVRSGNLVVEAWSAPLGAEIDRIRCPNCSAGSRVNAPLTKAEFN